MSPTHAQKGSRRYRYYVSQAVLQGRADRASVSRVPAPEVEAVVVGALRAARPASLDQSERELMLAHLDRVTIHDGRIEIALMGEDAPIQLPWSQVSFQRRRDIVVPPGSDAHVRPMKVEDRARILKAIATGRAWLEELLGGRMDGTEALALRAGSSERSVRMTLSLAFVSPAIVEAIVAGRLPRGIGIRHLAELPPSWTEQHAALGLGI
jgi:hypothetical protein